jgi:hypothetical protein
MNAAAEAQLHLAWHRARLRAARLSACDWLALPGIDLQPCLG